MRLDKWLWCVRLFKTRQLASDACRLGRVRCGGGPVKPARQAAAGDVLLIERPDMVQTVRVRALPAQRIAARWVPDFLEDLTPPAERERARQLREERQLATPTFHWDPHHLSRGRHQHDPEAP